MRASTTDLFRRSDDEILGASEKETGIMVKSDTEISREVTIGLKIAPTSRSP